MELTSIIWYIIENVDLKDPDERDVEIEFNEIYDWKFS